MKSSRTQTKLRGTCATGSQRRQRSLFFFLAHEAKLAEEEAKKSALSLELDAALGRLEELKLRLDGFVIDKTKLEVLDLLRWLESNPDFKLLDKWPGSEYLENLHALVHRADYERLLKEKELAVARDHREALGRELDGMKARLEVLRGRLNGENLTEKTKNEVLGLLAKVRGNPEFRNTPQWPGPGYLNGFEALLAKAEEEKAAHRLERLRATKERRDAVGVDLASHNVFTLELQHHLEGYLDADLTVDRANLNLDAVSLDD